MALLDNQTPNTFQNLATIHIQLGDWNAAQSTLDNAMKIFPNSTQLFQTYITLFFAQKRYFDALKIARKWVSIYDILESNTYLASTLFEIGNKIESLYYYERALRIDPNHVPSLINAAVIYNANGEHSKALSLATRGVKIDPNLLEGHVVMGAACISIGRFKNAIVALENALNLDPTNSQSKCKLINVRRHLCDWENYENDIADLARILKIESENSFVISSENRQQCNSPGNLLFFDLPIELLKEIAFISSQKLAISLAEQRKLTAKHRNENQSNHRVLDILKIGFVSFNFNNHPASHILAPLFRYLSNQNDTQIFAYSLNPIHDTWTKNIQNSVNIFRDISDLDIPSILEVVMHDGIDILIDLMGYTVGARGEIFACRPAPLQISYLGYPGSYGDPSVIDYTICDPEACELDQSDHEFAEKLILLPPPYFPAPLYEINKPTSMEISHQQQQLKIPAGKFVYCCLSKLSKISPKTFQIWSEILLDASNAILWLISRPIESVGFIHNESNALGLTNQILISQPLSRPDYLKYAPYICDLFLDTSPYNAHTVAAEMLSRGLPILTKRGVSLAGRVGASFLKTLTCLPNTIQHCAFLEALELSVNPLGRVPEHLTQLHYLQELYINDIYLDVLPDTIGR
ncbi:hypothetical protein LOD99_16037 [Oopsacas minuta]|uniref:protein O-GlcNAc transferase n=1 Tax=Oopsacas minuta TaxID=111878 RepID=A0AAV7K6M1_9METZ|nr:hypothetical protein LOD99_16037 [Oopsacas minuta]